MKREDLLKEMKGMVGTQLPTLFFEKMVDVFGLLFDKLENLEKQIKISKRSLAYAINWDEQCAKALIKNEIEFLRKTGQDPFDLTNVYQHEISQLQIMYVAPPASRETFCDQWQQILGYHPFLEVRDEE